MNPVAPARPGRRNALPLGPRPSSFSSRLLLWLGALAALSGCGVHARTPTPTPPARHAAQGTHTAQAPTLPPALVWVRRSAEYRALTRQTYAMAAARLADTVPALHGAAWGVILDADETILDNSEYERRRAIPGSPYSEESWAAWVREEAATAVPGAVAFTQLVHRMGGHVVVVTNRADSLCGPTRANLRRLDVPVDLVLCKPPEQPDKNPRFRRVQRGTASEHLPSLTIVEWIGDNIQDFPSLTQSVRHDPAALDVFGHTFFVLPNPLYGSWQRNRTR